MRHATVIIVGGGPAGSSCAWRLVREGIDCLILDRESFPRTKLCAGWITPAVVNELRPDIDAYPHRFLTFEKLHFHLPLVSLAPPTVQHSIRRYEFDAWLLERSGAPVEKHSVRDIEPDGDGFVIDARFHCDYLIGAGGTRCPVYRKLFRERAPRAAKKQVVALEEEFAWDWSDRRCHLWFFQDHLPGYAWYVPKADGYLNIGIGAMAEKLKGQGGDIRSHWERLTGRLERKGLVRGYDYKPKGYSYYVRGKQTQVRTGNAFIAGDAAGLATKDMAEGIGPAIRSGIMAAESIISDQPYDPATIERKSFEPKRLFLSWLLRKPCAQPS